MKCLITLILSAFALGCQEAPHIAATGATEFSDGGHQFAIYIINKEGHQFAVACSNHGAISIIELQSK